MKVHLEYAHPELQILSTWTEEGKAGHAAAVADLEPVPQESVRELLHAPGEHVFAEAPLEATLGGVPLKGRPDFLIVKDGTLRLVLDLKLGAGGQLWKSDRMQVEAYALVCAAMGLDASDAVVAIGVPARPRGQDRAAMSPAGRDDILALATKAASRARRVSGWQKAESADWRVFAASFSEELAMEDLEFKLRYWRGERAPLPVKVEFGKCRSCVMNAAGLCKDAHKPADGRWVIGAPPTRFSHALHADDATLRRPWRPAQHPQHGGVGVPESAASGGAPCSLLSRSCRRRSGHGGRSPRPWSWPGCAASPSWSSSGCSHLLLVDGCPFTSSGEGCCSGRRPTGSGWCWATRPRCRVPCRPSRRLCVLRCSARFSPAVFDGDRENRRTDRQRTGNSPRPSRSWTVGSI